MAPSPLKKATGNGFTVLPNKIIDEILQSSGKNVADTLALLIYCVRHIPAQSGTLSLHGNFSQGQICADLGWGPTNKQRLKRACQHLESVGVLDQELRDNNILLLHIKAELENQIPEKTQEGRGDAKTSNPVTKNPCAQGVKIPSTLYIENKYINNSQENLLEETSLENSKSVDHQSSSKEKDDDLEKLFSLYRELLKKPIIQKHRETFATTYLENAKPFTLVENAIRTISKHPKLHKDTVSINAVWQLPYMLRAARQFEANVRELLHSLKESGVQNVEQSIIDAAKESGVDLNIFTTFFADDISEASDKNRSVDPNTDLSSNHIRTEIFPNVVSQTEAQLLKSPNAVLVPASEKTPQDHSYESVVPVPEELKIPAPTVSNTQTRHTTEYQAEMPKEISEPNVVSLNVKGKRPQTVIPKFQIGPNTPNLDVAAQLIRAPTKFEFLSLIKAALGSPTIETRDKEILTSLLELTLLPNSTLSMLQTSIAQRFRLKKAS